MDRMSRLYGALVLLSLIWGLSFVFIKYLLEPAGVWGVVFLRCLTGVAVLIPLLLYRGWPPFRSVPWGSLVLVGVLNAGLPWGLIAWSETQIHSNTASILNATTPIWTSLIGVVAYSVMLTKRQWIGIVAGFVGIVILMDFQVADLFREHFVGIGTMLVATICYGFASHHTKRFLSDVDVLLTATVTLVTGVVVGLIGMAFTRGISLEALWNVRFAFALVGLGVFGSGIAYLLFFYMITAGGAQFAVNVTYLVPLTAIIWGAVLLHEPLSPRMMIGLFVIFAGIYLSTTNTKQKQTQVE
ncbi:DMT family transporter [Polycladomyces zharkentensis]